jgi:tripeptide aminopeptidase
MTIDRQRLLDRFLAYVQIHTTANPDTEEYPSSPGQWDLGRLLMGQLRDMGLKDVQQNEHGLVLATIPATSGVDCPVVAFNSHLDTSPEASGENVQPQVIENYSGGDIVLPGDPRQSIRVRENPELDQLQGCTLITTDGTTLLGGDDKAGVAIIMESAAYLMEHPEIRHGEIRLLFTCDEEVGRGVDHVDLKELAADVGYTLDGPGANTIDVETFSADEATVTIRGINIHPSIAKNRMVNAIRVAAAFIDALPRDTLAPEVTEGREGFLHPYRIFEGQVDEVVLKILLRDFDTPHLTDHAERLREAARQVQQEFPGSQVEIEIRPQYRNLSDGLRREPRATAYAEVAHQRLGRQAARAIIRGGTDGSRLTELGLPTPNLSSGQHNPHSPLEWVCLDEMVAAVEVIAELVQVWAEPQ